MKLFITKFKMHKDFTVKIPNSFHKPNGWGKSTILEAFLWVMNQKDQYGNEFTPSNVYPKNDHEQERYAEVTFVSSDKRTFKKTAAPIYSRVTGTDQVVLKTELSSTYFVGGEKVKKTEYDEAINDLTKNFELSLFCNPLHFFNLDQKGKMKVISQITNLNLIDYIAELPNKAAVKESIGRNKKQINDFKVEIQSLDRNFLKPSQVDHNEEIDNINKEIKALRDQEAQSINPEIERKNASLKIEIERLRTSKLVFKELPIFTPKDFLTTKPLLQLSETNEMIQKGNEYRVVKEEIERLEGIIQFNTDKLAELDQSIRDLDNNEFLHCSVCSHCDKQNCEFIKKDTSRERLVNARIAQMDRITEERHAAQAKLQSEKDRLTRIVKEGKDLKEKQAKADAEINEKNKQIIEHNNSVNEKNEEIEFENLKAKANHDKMIKEELKKREAAQKEYEEDLRIKIEELQSQIVSSYEKIDNTEKIGALLEKLDPIESAQIEHDKKLYAYEQAQQKVRENKSEIEEVQSALIEHEKYLYKIEEAERQYRIDCEEKINVILPVGVEMQLFRKTIGTGDYEDVAIVIVDGFTNPNTSRANSRLAQLCQNFQDHFNVSLPIFFDNAENCEVHNMPAVNNLVELRVISA